MTLTMGDSPVETHLFVNGEARPATGNRRYALHNPARPEEVVGHAAAGSPEDVDAAVRAAHAAYPSWAALSYAERADHLTRIADALTADAEDLAARARLFCREHGKILKECQLEMARLGDRFRLTASYADRLATDEHLTGPPFDTIITRQPRGVAALIVPWNWPLSILGAKLPQALMAGNTVVVKPSSNSALAPTLTLHLMARLLPPGVINVVTGAASEIGDALVTHPLVRFVNFTRYDEVVEGLSAACDRAVVGDGLLDETRMGPLNNAKQLETVTGLIEEARSKGADLRELGQVPDPDLYARGYFQKPVLALDPDPTLKLVTEEQFGPALPILPFETEDEAIAKANDSRFGLCSSVWTEDRDRATVLARRLEAGYTYLNAHGPTAQDSRGPFGGVKQSGLGRNLGYEGIIQFQSSHSISGPASWLFPN